MESRLFFLGVFSDELEALIEPLCFVQPIEYADGSFLLHRIPVESRH